MSEIVE
jgi:hypothetical protein